MDSSGIKWTKCRVKDTLDGAYPLHASMLIKNMYFFLIKFALKLKHNILKTGDECDLFSTYETGDQICVSEIDDTIYGNMNSNLLLVLDHSNYNGDDQTDANKSIENNNIVQQLEGI